MRKLIGIICLLAGHTAIKAQTIEKFSSRVITSELSNPWTIIYGPDDHLWITEGNSYKVSRIDPVNNTKTVIANLIEKRQAAPGGKKWPQNGLMGMALHPGLLNGYPYVYLSYISQISDCAPNFGGCIYKTTIVRYTYNKQVQQLTDPVIICDTIPASNDHNGGRMIIARDYLFYTVGDMGAGQFDNGGRTNHAQDVAYYEGKILRFNLSPDNDEDAYARWIPNDNPFNTGSTQSAVWSIGHRNPQGLAWWNGHLYSSEHGPYSDDEINIIERGKNYGHPVVIGYADGNYDGLAAGVSAHTTLPGQWHTTYPLITNEKANAQQIGAGNYRDPIKTLYPNTGNFLTTLFQKILHGDEEAQWPSEAPSSIAVYTHTAIPGWQNSLLVPTLKGGKLIRMQLNKQGDKIVSDTINYFKGKERYRAIAISPAGDKLYVAIDSSNITSGPSKNNPQQIRCSGCIIEFTYQGQ